MLYCSKQAADVKVIGILIKTGAAEKIEIWEKNYEEINHLGKVLVTMSDKKSGHTTDGTTVEY